MTDAVERRDPVKRFNKVALLGLLQMYEGAIRDLESLRDPGVTGLVRRLQLHRAEVIAALTALRGA
jgi:hypothetical protein